MTNDDAQVLLSGIFDCIAPWTYSEDRAFEAATEVFEYLIDNGIIQEPEDA